MPFLLPEVRRSLDGAAWRGFVTFWASTWRGRVIGAALAAWLLDALLRLAGWGLPSSVRPAVRVFVWVAVAWLAWRGLRWISERLLWRIRSKLILSYLFVALVPILLLGAFMAIAGLLLLGLVGSRIVTGEIDRASELLQSAARSALADLPAQEEQTATVLAARLAPVLDVHPRPAYTLLRGNRVVVRVGDAPREVPKWLDPPSFAGLVPLQPAERFSPEVLRAVWSQAGATLLLEVPADEVFYARIERRTGIHVFGGREIDVTLNRGLRDEGRAPAEPAAAGGFVSVAFPEKTNWTTGEKSAVRLAPLPFRYRPREIVERLSPVSLRELGMRTLPEFMLYLLGIVALVFVGMYGFALLLGLWLARQITRGVHELSVGTQRLREGDFSHVIRVHSHDQLGELAESFNLMSRSLEALMREQAERERLEEELRIARQIQMSLLPGGVLPTVPGVRVAALCLPAAEVGGDYYDLLPLDESRMGVLVADVSGKGTSAALYMAELKGLVLSLSRIHESPARLLSEANRILAANMDSRSFVTMTYAVIDAARRTMRYARAGHSPLIHFEASQRTTRILAPPGLGLGLDGGDRFEQILEEAEVPLQPGDAFLFFTDGLSEAMNAAAELFGERRLQRVLEANAGLGSEEMKQRILDEVRGFVGGAAPHDDMTLVVLKVVSEEKAV